MIKIIILFIFSSISVSQTISSYSYMGSYSSAVVGSMVSRDANPWSVVYNPASIAEATNTRIALDYTNLYSSSFFSTNNFSSIINISEKVKIGVAFSNFSVNFGGKDLSKEQTISFGQGVDLQRDKNSSLSIGYTLNYFQWSQAESAGLSGDGTDGVGALSVNSYGVDLGLVATLRGRNRVGFHLKNFNSPHLGKDSYSSYTQLTKKMTLGVSYNPLKTLSTSLEVERLLGSNQIQAKISSEYSLNNSLVFLFGLQSNPNRFGLGISIYLNKFIITSSILTHATLPATYNQGISFEL